MKTYKSLDRTETDLSKFIELYEGFGITIRVNKTKEGLHVVYLNDDGGDETRLVSTAENGKFGGYSGFYSSIWFDENGKFLKQNFLE